MACISYLDISGSPAHLRYLIQRLRQRLPRGTPILVGLWPSQDRTLSDQAAQRSIGADYYTARWRMRSRPAPRPPARPSEPAGDPHGSVTALSRAAALATACGRAPSGARQTWPARRTGSDTGRTRPRALRRQRRWPAARPGSRRRAPPSVRPSAQAYGRADREHDHRGRAQPDMQRLQPIRDQIDQPVLLARPVSRLLGRRELGRPSVVVERGRPQQGVAGAERDELLGGVPDDVEQHGAGLGARLPRG